MGIIFGYIPSVNRSRPAVVGYQLFSSVPYNVSSVRHVRGVLWRSLQDTKCQHQRQGQWCKHASCARRGGSGVRAALARVAGVTLAAEVLAQLYQLLMIHLAVQVEAAAPKIDGVCAWAQVKVRVSVRVPTLASSMPGTQTSTALLGCLRDVQQVAPERTRAKILVQTGTT